jgi:hypothetical protein
MANSLKKMDFNVIYGDADNGFIHIDPKISWPRRPRYLRRGHTHLYICFRCVTFDEPLGYCYVGRSDLLAIAHVYEELNLEVYSAKMILSENDWRSL